MKLPFTRKTLEAWSGARIFQEAQRLWERGGVLEARYEPPMVKGRVAWGTRELRTAVEVLPDGSAENHCPCHDNRERGLICAHVIALGLELIRQAYDPEAERKRVEEQRKAARLARLDESAFLQRVPVGTSGAVSARLRLRLPADWARGVGEQRIPVEVGVETGGQLLPIEQVAPAGPYAFAEGDETLLFVLEDICEGPPPSAIEVSPADFVNLLDLLQGKTLLAGGGAEAITVNSARIPSRLLVDLDRENGELLVMVQTELPYLKAGEFPEYVVCPRGGYAYGRGNFWPLEKLLPAPLHQVYREPVAIPRSSVPRFMEVELALLSAQLPVVTDLSIDLFSIEPATPRIFLHVRGSPAALAATLYAEYGTLALVAGKSDAQGHFSHPDPDDLMRYTVRNPAAEERALAQASQVGFAGPAGDELAAITGTRAVLNFLGRDLPALRRMGWRVDLEGRIVGALDEYRFATPVVSVQEGGAGGWFDIRFEYEDGTGGALSAADVQRALQREENFLERDGRTILIDGGAIRAMQEVFRDCGSAEGAAPGSFRLAGLYSAYVKSSLDALDGVDVEASPTWQLQAGQRNRSMKVEPVDLPPGVAATLRPYQHEGVNWLRFLERNGFCGILADEMGLGKTLQTLVWLRMARHQEDARGLPALIVCPTSLVENWAEETARFVPGLDALVVAGGDRRQKWRRIDEAGLVITSYALMRRDIDEYLRHRFAVIVLDEAQHIKNRSTQNAIAAKKLRGVHRLVLTGTPVENSVADLWSIMDFLMPGYLGGHAAFRERYEIPVGRGDRDGEDAQARLRRKLHPFLLRRLKRDVAKDLPPKIQRVAKFTMSPDQQAVYQGLREASQRRLLSLVSAQGFQKSRMEVLKTLLQLRQACCHLGLLKLPGLAYTEPSAKMDLFFELLDEALDGGHRVLVFSQFVRMLTLLREELDRRGLAYCYLDGSTRNRMEQVRQFNTDRRIPLFLISLKAGGTGLNLTGADMVVHFDPWWNPAVEDQATDRAYRIGQQRTVYSIKLIARDSVEEKVLALQERKKAVIQATLASDEQVLEKLDWEDVQELLSL